MARISRRGFLMGCSAAIAAMAGSRITNLAFAAPQAQAGLGQLLVVVFLRGGWDALNVVAPIGGPDAGIYEASRPNIKLARPGQPNGALVLNGQFGMHPAFAPLLDLYQGRKLAFVHAAGMPDQSRSHFDAMAEMELGTPGNKGSASGWLTRHMQTAPGGLSGAVFPALSTGGGQAMSLAGFNDAISMDSPNDFGIDGWDQYVTQQRTALRMFYAGPGFVDQSARTTLDTLDLIERTNPGSYTPPGGVTYPQNSYFAENLATIAQLYKMGLGLSVATVDLGGWDTHENQGTTASATDMGGYFANQLSQLAGGLKAFYRDLDVSGHVNKLTVLVMSEFGRRLDENPNRGTDHGHGSVLIALGGQVQGGNVYGRWPGLGTDQLYDRADLAITTDYRQLLAECLVNRFGNANISTVFPGFRLGQTLGVFGPLACTPPVTGGNPPPDFPGNLPQRVYVPSSMKNGAPSICR